MPSWNDFTTFNIFGGTPHFSRTFHRDCHRTESEAFFRSTMSIYSVSLCSLTFSISYLATKVMSTQPWLFLKPHCDSGRTLSSISSSLSFNILAINFLTTSRRLIPRQLSQHLRSPFLRLRMITTSCQSLTTLPFFHTCSISFKILSHSSGPPCLTSSGSIPDFPPAFLIFILLKASNNSSSVNGESSSVNGAALASHWCISPYSR